MPYLFSRNSMISSRRNLVCKLGLVNAMKSSPMRGLFLSILHASIFSLSENSSLFSMAETMAAVLLGCCECGAELEVPLRDVESSNDSFTSRMAFSIDPPISTIPWFVETRQILRRSFPVEVVLLERWRFKFSGQTSGSRSKSCIWF